MRQIVILILILLSSVSVLGQDNHRLLRITPFGESFPTFQIEFNNKTNVVYFEVSDHEHDFDANGYRNTDKFDYENGRAIQNINDLSPITAHLFLKVADFCRDFNASPPETVEACLKEGAQTPLSSEYLDFLSETIGALNQDDLCAKSAEVIKLQAEIEELDNIEFMSIPKAKNFGNPYF